MLMFFKIGPLKNLVIFTGKHVLKSLFNKLAIVKAFLEHLWWVLLVFCCFTGGTEIEYWP